MSSLIEGHFKMSDNVEADASLATFVTILAAQFCNFSNSNENEMKNQIMKTPLIILPFLNLIILFWAVTLLKNFLCALFVD